MAEIKASVFGSRLHEAAGLTESQLAQRAGLHTQGVVKLEIPTKSPPWR
jgi:hypothetical protein